MRILTVTAVALLVSSACSKNSESDDKSEGAKTLPAPGGKPRAEKKPEKPPASQRPEGPTGALSGAVFLDGEAPEMPLLRRQSDPACSQKEVRAETIMVGENGDQQGLANVLVRIKPGTVPGWVPDEPIVVDQVDCMYRPRVQGGVRGQSVQVANSDHTAHNVHARELPLGRRMGVETIFNRAQPEGVSLDFELGKQDVAKLKCDYHGWMQGYIVVSDNPYFGVSDKDGTFRLEGLPVGTHTIESWHEYYGMKSAEVTVEEGGESRLEFRYSAQGDKPGAAGKKSP